MAFIPIAERFNLMTQIDSWVIRNTFKHLNKVKVNLKKVGFCFALDDFGTGMSSFSYLKNLPVDYLKIDGEFIKDIINSTVDSTMVDSINRIGKSMGMKTIAEFVENNETIEHLKKLNIDFAQGYGIFKPALLTIEENEISQVAEN